MTTSNTKSYVLTTREYSIIEHHLLIHDEKYRILLGGRLLKLKDSDYQMLMNTKSKSWFKEDPKLELLIHFTENLHESQYHPLIVDKLTITVLPKQHCCFG